MSEFSKISWPRIVAEGAAIVISILLAFWIDAWWQRQTELREADLLIAGLNSDFQMSQTHLSQWLAGNERVLEFATAFLEAIRDTGADESLAVPHEWVVAAIAAPTYSPTDTSLRTAVATGQIELIEDAELRNMLAVWRQQLDDTQEDEILIREIVVNHLVPRLSEQIRLGRAFEFDPMINWFTGRESVDFAGTYSIRATSELEGVLAERVFYSTFVVQGLAEISRTQTRILELLQEHSDGR